MLELAKVCRPMNCGINVGVPTPVISSAPWAEAGLLVSSTLAKALATTPKTPAANENLCNPLLMMRLRSLLGKYTYGNPWGRLRESIPQHQNLLSPRTERL